MLDWIGVPVVWMSEQWQVCACSPPARRLFEDMGFSLEDAATAIYADLQERSRASCTVASAADSFVCISRPAPYGGYLVLLQGTTPARPAAAVSSVTSSRKVSPPGRGPDLLAPLSTILLGRKVLEQRLAGDRQSLELLDSLDRACRQLRGNVVSLMDERRTPDRTSLALDTLCARSLERLEPVIKARGHRIVTRFRSAMKLWADPVAVGDAVSCLLENAIESSATPMVIKLEIFTTTGEQLPESACTSSEVVVLRVRDFGPRATQQALTGEFDPCTFTSRRGASLTLGGARGLVRDQGGDLILEATSLGASFLAIFPASHVDTAG